VTRDPDSDGLIYKPARREKVGLIVGLSGPSWSGKTFSALRLARGLAGRTGRVALLDTERGRGLTYADDFEFDHGELNEPFTPDRYADAAALSKRAGHNVLIIDSMSHEWAGPGGVLEMHESELTRLAGNDFGRREAMKMVAWIKPKVAHKAMVQRLLQLNSHLILCFRAEEKTEIQMLPNKQGKLVATPVNIGFQPITSKDMAYELTILLGFDPKNPGVPLPIKLADKFKPFVPLDRVLDEETGARLAAWARGEKPAQSGKPTGKPVAETGKPPPETGKPAVAAPTEPEDKPAAPEGKLPAETGKPSEKTGKPEPEELPFPGDLPLTPPLKKKLTAGQAIAELTARFEAVMVRADHLVIVDAAENRERIAWLKKNHKEASAPLVAAMEASWARTMPQKEPV
jgi:hypothetical protein